MCSIRLIPAVFLVMMGITSFGQQGTLNIRGIWKIESVQMVKPDGSISTTIPLQSQVIFAKSYYSFCWTSDTVTARSWTMSDSAKLARMNQTIVNTGTYHQKGSLLTTKASFGLNPMFTNGTATFSCSMSKDTLVLKGLSVFSAGQIAHPVYASGAHFVTRLVKTKQAD